MNSAAQRKPTAVVPQRARRGAVVELSRLDPSSQQRQVPPRVSSPMHDAVPQEEKSTGGARASTPCPVGDRLHLWAALLPSLSFPLPSTPQDLQDKRGPGVRVVARDRVLPHQ